MDVRQRRATERVIAKCDADELYWQGRWAGATLPTVRAVAAKKLEDVRRTRAHYKQALEEDR